MKLLCASLPADWWDLGDGGNRLALALCSVCPALKLCLEGDPEPHGVIRGGVAWSNGGDRLPICACGRPAPNVARADCFTCEPRRDTPLPSGGRGPAERHACTIRALLDEAWSYRAIAVRIGSNAEAVRGVARRHGWRSKLAGRPRAVSTEEDAA